MVIDIRDHIVLCPICDRRFKTRVQRVGQTVRCQQCRCRIGGAPESHSPSVGRPTAIAPGRTMATSTRQTVVLQHDDSPRMPTLLLVEPRDEVYARLASDLTDAGFLVMRAVDEKHACRSYLHCQFELVIANADLSRQGGSMLARVLRTRGNGPSLWLYKTRKTAVDVSCAKSLRVDELIGYRGDLFALSDRIVDCLAGKSPKSSVEPTLPKEIAGGRTRIAA